MSEGIDFGGAPRVLFGAGVRTRLPAIAASHGPRLLLVTGSRSLRGSVHGRALADSFAAHGLEVRTLVVASEPSPALVDEAVREHRPWNPDSVVGIGGGSALDAAKAIAGMLPSGRSVMDHLEEVGRGLPYEGPAIPLIAAPTTAGTGSEATRNAVLSVREADGFKRSFRHEALVPRWAVVDPDLLSTCPSGLIAADGLDALTQLLEAYVSPRANDLTRSLVEHGLDAVREGLLPWFEGDGDPAAARAAMARAALLSGFALAQAGLGVVHGLSAPLGAWFPIPHGVACGTLLATATAVNVRALRARAPDDDSIGRYARAWARLAGAGTGGVPGDGPERLVALLGAWTARLAMPGLGAFGVAEADLPRVAAAGRGGSSRTNPIELDDAERVAILRARLDPAGSAPAG